MDGRLKEIGDRIRGGMPEGMSQGELARRVGMAPDALSRAMNGKRGFSAVELTAIGEELGQSLHWLITGRPDPFELRLAARSSYDPVTRSRSNPGERDDRPVIDQVVRVYREAYPDGAPVSPDIPVDAGVLRAELGQGFVREFSKRVEALLKIDIVRLPMVSTDYSLMVGRRKVILLATNQNWFRSNWSLAHELGHFALGHHLDAARRTEQQENEADEFASTLLLPEAEMRSRNWGAMSAAQLARFIWDSGVSREAVQKRLAYLRINPSREVAEALGGFSTPKLLRDHADVLADGYSGKGAIGERQQEALARRWPAEVIAELTARVESGEADPWFAAQVLDVPVDELDYPEPPTEEEAAARYAEMVGGGPSDGELEEWLEDLAGE